MGEKEKSKYSTSCPYNEFQCYCTSRLNMVKGGRNRKICIYSLRDCPYIERKHIFIDEKAPKLVLVKTNKKEVDKEEDYIVSLLKQKLYKQ